MNPVTKRSNSYKQLDDKAIIRRYKKGETLVRIAKSLGVAQATINNRLREYSIPRRKQGVLKKDIDLEELVRLREEMSFRKLGQHFDVSYTTIRKRWQACIER